MNNLFLCTGYAARAIPLESILNDFGTGCLRATLNRIGKL